MRTLIINDLIWFTLSGKAPSAGGCRDKVELCTADDRGSTSPAGGLCPLTCSPTSTLVETVVALVRSLHALTPWTQVINTTVVDHLSILPTLLADLTNYQLQVTNSAPGGPDTSSYR